MTKMSLWYVEGGQVKKKGRGAVAPPPPTGYTPVLPIDPGEDKYLIGYSLGPNGALTLPAARTRLGYPGDGRVSVIHDYSSNNTGIDTASINSIIAAGMIPSQSIKLKSYSVASIAAGTRDAAIDTMANFCATKKPWPIILCFWHEPGGDFGGSANTQAMNDYRDATRHMVTRFRAAGADNVMWTCILETPWNFAGNGVAGAPVSGSPPWMDFRFWHADWDFRNNRWYDDIMMDIFGVDLYTPMIGGAAYRQMSTDMGYVKTKLAATGAPNWPFGIFEFGMNNDAKLHNWPDYGTKAKQFMKDNDVKILCYWDNSDDIGRYSFGPQPAGHNDPTDFDDDGTKATGWATLYNGGTKWSA